MGRPSNSAAEFEKRHVGASPGAIHGKETQSAGRQPEQMTIAVRHQFISPLGCCVKLQRVIGAIVLAERHLGIGAIDAARAGIGQMAHFGMTAAFQNVSECD